MKQLDAGSVEATRAGIVENSQEHSYLTDSEGGNDI